jgi:hypothetical protein
VRISQSLKSNYGTGGGLMIFVRTVDGDGVSKVPIEQLALHDAHMREVGNIALEAERDQERGWACWSARVDPGGYALRWQKESARRGTRAIDQSLWVSADWLTIMFIGYRSEFGILERESASIHMALLDVGFQPGPELSRIHENQASEEDLKGARINQALDLALGGLRTGNQVVPDDLIDLLQDGKYQNPMLGIVCAHAILRRHPRDWNTFDLVLQNMETVIPGHPDVVALRVLRQMLLAEDDVKSTTPVSWPPMLSTGYRGLVDGDWLKPGKTFVDGSMAESVAVALLSESPWTYWLELEALITRPLPVQSRKLYYFRGNGAASIERRSDQPTGREASSFGRVVAMEITLEGKVTPKQIGAPDPSAAWVARYIAGLKEMSEGDLDLSKLSIEDFRPLGLPVSVVERAVHALGFVLGVSTHTPVEKPSAHTEPLELYPSLEATILKAQATLASKLVSLEESSSYWRSHAHDVPRHLARARGTFPWAVQRLSSDVLSNLVVDLACHGRAGLSIVTTNAIETALSEVNIVLSNESLMSLDLNGLRSSFEFFGRALKRWSAIQEDNSAPFQERCAVWRELRKGRQRISKRVRRFPWENAPDIASLDLDPGMLIIPFIKVAAADNTLGSTTVAISRVAGRAIGAIKSN